MSEMQPEASHEEIIRNTAEFVVKLMNEGVFKFSFGPVLSNPVPMISDCLLSHDKGTFDPLVIAVFDTIETLLKLSVRWMPDRVVVGSGVVAYENNFDSKQRAKMWATMLHVSKFKTVLMGANYVS